MIQVKKTFITPQKKPLVIEPAGQEPTFEEFLDFLEKQKQSLKQEILKHGGILFRGFPIEGSEGFHHSIQALGLGEMLNYIGGDSPRDKVKGKVYTSTEAPPSLKIPLHNEMSFIRDYPKHIYFYCQTPAKSGGATILGDASAIYRNMPSRIRDHFEEKGLRYVSNYYKKSFFLDLINKIQRSHKTWMEVFETSSPEEVEKKCHQSDFGFEWRKNQWLQIQQRTPAIMEHPETKEKIWFNQAHLYDFNPRLVGFFNWLAIKAVYSSPHTIMHEIFYKDGECIPKKDLYDVMDVLDACTISYPWQKKDFLVLDNVLMMHGRAPFKGKRKIFTALTR
jgi:alpha-ketoglutarate-dependent taurine dioxygenase